MRKRIAVILVTVMATMALAMGASAEAPQGPCDGDGKAYGTHHIAFQAKTGGIGGDGHVPGTHQGFSVCNPSGR